jgi:hypothetical protein
VVLPGLISSLMETIRSRREGAGEYIFSDRFAHVVIIGQFQRASLVSGILSSFLHNVRADFEFGQYHLVVKYKASSKLYC